MTLRLTVAVGGLGGPGSSVGSKEVVYKWKSVSSVRLQWKGIFLPLRKRLWKMSDVRLHLWVRRLARREAEDLCREDRPRLDKL